MKTPWDDERRKRIGYEIIDACDYGHVPETIIALAMVAGCLIQNQIPERHREKIIEAFLAQLRGTIDQHEPGHA
jgi:hypothetical protein